jgi:branched-chain amino acid transport system permease protein
MELAIQTITNALIMASIYILLGLGFAFIFNILGVFNIAHGALYMVSGYLGYLLIGALHINQWIGLISVVVAISVFGIFMERFCFRPFLRDFNRQLMICIVLSTVLETSVNITIGSQNFVIPKLVPGIIDIGPYSVAWDRIVVFALGIIILYLVFWFVNHTRWGMQMQAITQNIEGAALQGINIHHISAIVCALGCSLAALAGVQMGSMYILDPFMGSNMLGKILMLIFLAGVGSFGGIFLIGLIMGALYAGLPILLPGAASNAVALSIVCIILLLRPQGFFGREA